MPKILIGLILVAAIATCGWTVYRQVQPTAVSVTIGEEPEEITFVCTETGEVSHGEWAPTPAMNPKTGRRTLMQGLYCSQCRKWYPAPPPEMAERSPRGPACPHDGSTLTVEEPVD